MTVTLFSYKNSTQTANIEIEKYCSHYTVVIFNRKYNFTELRRNYWSIKTAKQAIKKYADPGLIETYNYYKEKKSREKGK